MKYALVIIETPASRQAIRADRAKHRQSIERWVAEQAAAGRLVGGEAFETEAEAPATIRRLPSGDTTVTDGPFAGTDETLGGYMLIDVAGRDEAVAVARTWPATGEAIEVRPLWQPS